MGDRAIVEAVQDEVRQKFGAVEITDIPMDVMRDGASEALEKLNACDLVILGGGGVFYRWFLPFDSGFISRILPKIVIFGVGYINEFGAPELGVQEKESIRYLCEKASLVSVRDSNTVEFLRVIGVQKEIYLVGDPAILLSEEVAPVEFADFNIGFNLNYSGWLGFGTYRDKIIASYRECIEISRTKGRKVFYLLHHPSEMMVLGDLGVGELEVVSLPPKQQKWVYGKLDLVVGMMLHSVVLAFGAGTPEINVAYDVRNVGFAEFIGVPELVLKPEDLGRGVLNEKIEQVMAEESKYKILFSSKKKEIIKLHDKLLDMITEMIR